ncbi:MAG: ABC transporter permease subunit [Lachnospiraceae bacterium]|nr:ABC transporter permease subunit [Lachnospiraceae bacterium]
MEGLKRIPLRFWAPVAGLAGILICLMSSWVNVTNSKTMIQIDPDYVNLFNIFSLISQPESNSIQTFIVVLVLHLVLAVVLLISSIVLLIKNNYKAGKFQVLFTSLGFILCFVVPLIFIIFAASINDPALMKVTAAPAIQAVIALIALFAGIDKLKNAIKKDWQLYALLVPAIILVFIFVYLPMYGIQIAFRDLKPAFGIAGSKWIDLKNFTDFFGTYYSTRLITNTFLLNIYGLLWGFPIPIIMAIFLHQLTSKTHKRFTQTVIYAPHFISPVVMVGMIFLFLSPSTGLVNKLIEVLGGTPIAFMLDSAWFRTVFIATDVWQHAGWNTILYIATLTAIDPSLNEAAKIDGATKMQRIKYIDIPHLLPIIVMLLILNCGTLLASNVDKALLMQTDANIPTSDIIGLYVYRMGIQNGQFSFTAAINLLVNVINFVMIITVNTISKRLNQSSLF